MGYSETVVEHASKSIEYKIVVLCHFNLFMMYWIHSGQKLVSLIVVVVWEVITLSLISREETCPAGNRFGTDFSERHSRHCQIEYAR